MITPPKEDPGNLKFWIYNIKYWLKFLRHCCGGLELLLLFAAISSFAAYPAFLDPTYYISGIVLILVVLLGATLAFV